MARGGDRGRLVKEIGRSRTTDRQEKAEISNVTLLNCSKAASDVPSIILLALVILKIISVWLKALKNRKRLKNKHKHPKEIPQNRNPPDPPKSQIAPKSYQKRIKKEGKGRGRKRGMGLCVPKSKQDKLSEDKREIANKRIDKHKDATNETRPSIIHAVRFSVSEARKAGKSRLDESWKWRRSQKHLEKVRRKSRAESCRKAAR